MAELLTVMAKAIEDLGRLGGCTALVGGFAFGLRVRPRMTKDIDLAVAVADDAAAEQLVAQLLRNGYRVGALVEQVSSQRLATVRLCMPNSTSSAPDLDLLFATCGIEADIVAAATPMRLDPIGAVRVARSGHLIAMKCLAESERRPQDRVDLQALVELATADELALAATAIRAITAAGYARGKDLQAVLDGYIARRPR